MRKILMLLFVTLSFQLSALSCIYAAGLPWELSGNDFSGGTITGGTEAGMKGVTLDKNMVTNPGLEGSASPPTGWSYSAAGTWAVSTGIFHSGSRSIVGYSSAAGDAFAATPEGASSNISCVPGGMLFVSFWIKTQEATVSPRIRIIWWSKTGVYAGEGYYNSSGLITGTTDWTYSSGTASPPAGAYFMSFRAQNGGTGTMWFDDAYVEDLSAPIYTASGYYESPEFDNGSITAFGKISWVADVPAGCSIALKTRTSADGVTWDHPSWATAPVYSVSDSVITNTPGRYIQFRADLSTQNRSVSPLLKEIKITSALKGVGSASGCVMKPGSQLVLYFDFNAPMDTNNGSCVVTLTDGSDLQTVVSPGDGTWVDSQHFQTLPYAIAGIAGGFADLEITGPNIIGGTGNFYNYASSVLLIDTADISPLTMQFFPDPFSPNGDGKADQASLLLMLSSPKTITLKVYDLRGRLVKILAENKTGMGEGLIWDGTDSQGRMCQVGLYVYQLKIDDGTKPEFKSGTVALVK